MWEQLMAAIKVGYTAKAKELIQELDGKYYNWFKDIKELDRAESNGETALTLAALRGLEDVCKLLIPKMAPASLNAVNRDGQTALHLAEKGYYKGIYMLLPDLTGKTLEEPGELLLEEPLIAGQAELIEQAGLVRMDMDCGY